jgi:hypothetical protein
MFVDVRCRIIRHVRFITGGQDMDDDLDRLSLPEEERRRLISALQKMVEMGIAAVYGGEDEGVPDAPVDCGPRLGACGAKCCTLVFALTKEEVSKGLIRHNPERPFFIARDADGYCPHLDRDALRCEVWKDRPLRCRRYDCRTDSTT